ncbi:hypothetical protein RF11_11353 [Thelohanellus kitauei]|nr:hypothetical protein RF11_13425 [Thelohanellus kitauei]KII67503.1 hypothetical protein RF11_11353 [Thelohanellus kitauei]
MTRLVQRTRRDANTPLPSPNSLSSLALPIEYTLSHRGEQFLQYDSGPDENRMLIFSTNNNLELLRSSDCWYCDGTFKTAPSLFSQLYTVHCKINNTVIPTVYGLLPTKSESIYTSFFTAISNLKPGLSPATIMLDFEISSHNALRRVFPQTILKGCFYHLSQSFWRKIQMNAPTLSRYREDGDFVITAKMILAICFVPIPDICFAFEQLLFSDFFVNDAEILNCLSDYFEDFYIGRILRLNTRRPPLFPHSLWNCYDATINNNGRTNNSVEGWHNGFARFINCHHPDIFKFLEFLKSSQNLNEVKITQLQSGMVVSVERNRYKDHNQRLANICNTYRRENIVGYLRNIAYNITI